MGDISESTESKRSDRYRINEKVLSMGFNFKITDCWGSEKYTVRSNIWTWGKYLILEQTNGHPLLKIRQKGIRFLDQYQIISIRTDSANQILATVRQKFAFLKQSYEIYSIYGNYQLKAMDIFDHSFVLKSKNNQSIAIVSKKFFSLADNYDVEIINYVDEGIHRDHALILALILVLHCSLYGS